MDDLSSRSLRKLLRPYYTLSRAMGLRTFNCRSQVKSKLGLLIPLFFWLYFICEWFITQAKRRKLKKNHIYHIVEYLYYGAFVLRFITVVSSVIVGLFRSKTWEYMTRSLDKVNKTLEVLGSKPEFSSMYTRLLIEMGSFFVYLITTASSFTYTICKRVDTDHLDIFDLVMFIFSYIYGEIVEFTVTMDFLTAVRCIKSEMQRANDLLNDVNVLPLSSIAMELIEHREMDNNSFRKVLAVAPLSMEVNSRLLVKKNEILRIRRLIRTIRQVHLELYRISKNLSSLYGIQVSSGMAMSIFYSTCYFYALYTWIYDLIDGRFFVNELFMMNTFCAFVISKIFVVNFTCDMATKETEKTREIIYTFYAENSDPEIQEEVKMFSIQVMHCNFSLTAFDLYAFNCKNICACVGIIATYLVIMIQMTEK